MFARTKLFTFMVLALGLAFGAVSVSAQERPEAPSSPGSAEAPAMGKMHGRHKMRGHDRMVMRELRGIELSDAQKEQIRVIRETFKPNPQEMEDMRTIMTAKRAGTATADQETRLEAIHASMKQRNENIRVQVMGILTPEQRTQIEQRKVEREKKRAERKAQMKQRRTAPQDKQ